VQYVQPYRSEGADEVMNEHKCNYDADSYPKGRCPDVDDCSDADLPCYGSLCDDCLNTCKGKFIMGVCIFFRDKVK